MRNDEKQFNISSGFVEICDLSTPKFSADSRGSWHCTTIHATTSVGAMMKALSGVLSELRADGITVGSGSMVFNIFQHISTYFNP